jgi:4-phospho-D-threonate 3-dehydrogenase / 4-phospho-D-erythronate 3-dehydrogenase
MDTDDRAVPNIAVTLGDPSGIGPEVVLKALFAPEIASLAKWILVGDSALLRETGKACGIDPGELSGTSMLDLRAMREPLGFAPGQLNGACGRAAVEYVRHATQMCLRGEAHAMVTAPLNKEAVTLSGMKFTGHTEFIAELCGVRDSRMLLASERMRVVHVSTHISLRKSCQLSNERIVRTIELGNEAAMLLGFERPHIAVCGLNPHAGEHGLFGDEDMQIVAPAVETAQARRIWCEGPLPADTTFLKAFRGAYDLVVAMYHDQGHIPMKLMDFEHTVNISLGIPIIRTSPDHGTAFDIAGQNKADPTNMKAAMKMAASMASRRLRQQ